MKRREIVVGGGAVLLSAALARAQDHAARGAAVGDGKMHHAMHGGALKVPVNDAVLRLAAGSSSHLKGVAAAVIPVYEACEAWCRKREAKHAICKQCAEACVQPVAAIPSL